MKPVWLLALLVVSIQCGAQTPFRPQSPTGSAPPTSPIQTAPVPEDPLGRSTPYATVANFVSAVERGDLERASNYLDLRRSLTERQEAAGELKRIIDRGLKINLNTLSKRPEGDLLDDSRPTRELVGIARVSEHSLHIFLDRVQFDQQQVWLFSGETLEQVPFFAARLEKPWILQYVPESLQQTELAGVPLYRWILIPLLLLALLATAWVAAFVVVAPCRLLFRSQLRQSSALMSLPLAKPLRMLLFACLLYASSHYAMTIGARQFWVRVAGVLLVVAAAWLLLRVIDSFSSVLVERLQQSRMQHRIAAVQLLRGSTKAVICIAALLVLLYRQGIDLTTAVAGLGIGGLAIAFAAQKTIENLFGTVTLVTDAPVRMGDFCRVGDKLGTIENIGLRSTRIRTLARTVVTIPNGQVAGMVLENFAHREQIWFNHLIGLRYETTADQLREVLRSVRAMLNDDFRVERASASIRLVRVGASSLDLDITAYILTASQSEFLAIQEDLLLHILDIIEHSGTRLAVPTQRTYLLAAPAKDNEKPLPRKAA